MPKSSFRRRLGVVAGVIVLAALAAFFVKRAQRQAGNRTAAAAVQERLRRDERAARLRACKLPEGATLHETVSVQGDCQAAVVKEWKSPGSVVYPGMLDEDGPLESPDGCVTTYRSWVIGPGPDGANFRQPYLCTFDPRTGSATIELLDR